MAYLRFNRDKRGYENTAVVDSDRRKGKSPRILYLFRTPPGVKIGRAPLDQDAIRLLEEHNPGVEFDWQQILDGERRPQPKPAAVTPPPQPQPRPKKAPVAEPTTVAGARLGAEGLARLRARYADILGRIRERVEDADRRAELKLLADRLNPDGWVTDEDVVAGLDAYEVTFESVRTAIGPRRRPSKPAPQAE